MSVKGEKHNSFFNMTNAFKEKHCPVYFLSRQSVTRFFDGFLYERVNDPVLRDSIFIENFDDSEFKLGPPKRR
jgi:hypothetical protein